LPRYILLVDISTSALWDGQADLKVFRQLDELIRDRYRLEAVMPVRPPVGHLLLESANSSERDAASKPPSISVYRLATTS
jgi:hypothetical protein